MARPLRAPVDAAPAAGGGPAARRPWHTAQTYLLAAAASTLAWLLSYPLEPYVDRGDFPLYLGAVMLSAWYGGLGPGLLTTLVGAFVGVKALVGAGADSASLSAAVVTRLGVFVLEALVICVVCGLLRRTESRAQALAASEQGARRELEAAAHQIRAVQRVTDTALTHLRLDDLLPELLGRVRDAMAADTVVILLLNDEGTELAVRAAHGLEEEVTLDMRIPFGRGIAGSIAARGATMVIEDVSQAEVVSPILRAKGLHTLLGTPLVLDGRGIGVVHVGSLSPRRFTPDDARLLEFVADRIATAIGRARLFEAEQRARHDAETAEGRFRLLVDGVRDYAFYMLDRAGRVESWNAGAERLEGYTADEIIGQHVARFYLPEEARQGAPARSLERAAAEGRAVEEGWRVRKDGSRFWAEGLTTAVRDPEGRFVGYSVVTHDVTERRRHAEVRARLLEQVTAAQEEEQRRLARELHDETGQSLTSLLVGLRTLAEAPSLAAVREQAVELRRVTARTLDEVRRLARGLRPGVLDELGLVPAVDQLAIDHAQMRSMAVEVSAVGFGLERLPPAVEAALYRIIQEALTNAAKHSGARTANVVLQRRREMVQAIVSDDGCGFDVEGTLRTPAARAHLGLHGMRERAALLDGTVTIESTPGEGTTIYARVPILEALMVRIRILIADDHAVLRTGLRMLIGSQRDLDVVGEASDGDEAVRKAAALRPDVALVDISMPGSGGIKAIERIREAAPATRVVVLTMHDMPAYLRAALAAGASGYVVKRAADSALLAAIRDVHRGRTVLDPALAASVVQSGLRRGRATGTGPATPLSQREREVLELVAQGYTNQQIADHLGLSVKTVETYRARLVEKLGLQSRAELVRYALDSGLFGGEASSTS